MTREERARNRLHALGYRLWTREGGYFVNHGGNHHHSELLPTLDMVERWIEGATPATDDCPGME